MNPGPGSRRRRRFRWPTKLVGVSEKNEKLFGSDLWLVSLVRSLGGLWDLLKSDPGSGPGGGRPRNPGHWRLLWLIYTASDHAAMEPFLAAKRHHEPTWRACGFVRDDGSVWVPSYETLRRHFIEIESENELFLEAHRQLVAIAQRRDDRVGEHLWCDGTESQTHAIGHHDCGVEDDCPDRELRRLVHLDTKRATKMRHAEVTDDPNDPDERASRRRLVRAATELDEEDCRPGRRYRAGRHWWYIADPDAGFRVYSDSSGRVKESWAGDLQIKVVDLFTGLPIVALSTPADQNEVTNYPKALSAALSALGGQIPRSMTADSAYYSRGVYEQNMRLGILTVTPTRRRAGDTERGRGRPGPDWDQEGDPLCRHCSGPTRRVGYSDADGRQRITFACLLPKTTRCERRQTISCSRDPRRLLPVSRRTPVYRALNAAVKTLESSHSNWRCRYRVGAKNLDTRPKRLGNGPRLLRASAALVIDWLRGLWNLGWIGPGDRCVGEATPIRIPPPHN
ncbi:hypothetical protein [Miltoncostaea oceani]|uniref:hypothetical protein n=1 Tax=Miltoncostaea oceani TaxID=2843216 RepID=UPI001C3CB329|nr:hypothetical protein [Miltoncostaea oceani]